MSKRADHIYKLCEFLGDSDVSPHLQQSFSAKTWRNLRGANTPRQTVLQELEEVEHVLQNLKGKLPEDRVIEGYKWLNNLRLVWGLPQVH